MKIDPYNTKSVLSVIAFALLVLAFRPLVAPPQVRAEGTSCGVTKEKPCFAQIATREGYLPVELYVRGTSGAYVLLGFPCPPLEWPCQSR